MASSEPQFQMKVEHCLTPNTAPQLPNVEFLLHIRTSVRDDHGYVWQDPNWQPDTQEEIVVLPESVFGSELHRNVISRRLLEAGWLDQGHRELILDLGFSVSNSIIEKEKEKKKKKNQNNNTSDDTLRIIFRVEKIVRMEYYDELDLEATAMELSMQEEPKLVPATIESIQALKKTKLVEGFSNGDDIECMVCMEKLVSFESEVVTCMPCSHLFHADCIERWLNTCHLCPLCRFPMPTDAGNH